jgi:hypothetical protein
MGLFRSSTIGQVVQSHVEVLVPTCALDSIFYVSTCSPGLPHSGGALLQRPLYMVQDNDMNDVITSCWKHDSELGRGYLLISTAAENGRVWRWETGGGPIAIGRSLCVEQSGCRSNLYDTCSSSSTTSFVSKRVGSGGIAVDSTGSEHLAEGHLIVAEWGEGRIVRLEENGARTPLIMHVPDLCASVSLENDNETTTPAAEEKMPSLTRIHQPWSLLFTPFGDLLVLDHTTCSKDGLFRLKRVAKAVKPLESLQASRKAHSWTSVGGDYPTTKDQLPETLWRAPQLGGMVLDTTFVNVYVTTQQEDQRVVLVSLSLKETDDDDEDEDENKEDARQIPRVVLDYSAHASTPGAIAIDRLGRIFLAVDLGILVVAPREKEASLPFTLTIVGKLPMSEKPTSLTLGEDGFLYITTQTSLLRIRVKQGPAQPLMIKK